MLFHFNLYSSLLLLGFVQGMVMTAVLLVRGWREDKLADRLLALLILLLSLHIAQFMLGFAGWYDQHDWHATFMFYFPFHLYLLIGPVLYFYFLSLTNQEFNFSKQDRYHFIPGVLLLSLVTIVFTYDFIWVKTIQGIPFPSHYGTRGYWAEWINAHVDEIISNLGLLSALIYLTLTIYRYHQYRNYLNDHFSETRNIEFHWLRNVLYAVLIAFLFRLMMLVIGEYFPDWGYKQYWLSYFGFAVVIYFISIQGYTATLKIPRDLKFTVPSKEQEVVVKEVEDDLVRWKNKLTTLMDNEAPYLQPDLTLNELSKKLKTNPSLLSKIINQSFGQNFNDYINTHRVEAVKQKLQNNASQQLTLLAIAMECGFNSKATFNRAFRKFTGQSPREFLMAYREG